MRIIHTADWHLGHTLHEISREYEQRCFLAWLGEALLRERADALLVCGDIFDSANPPAAAQRMWFDFIGQARRTSPRLQIVVVGGNHDSAERLDAPEPLLRELGVRIVGGLARDGLARDGLARRQRGEAPPLCLERMIVTLHDRSGTPRAIVAAAPFIRPADVPDEAASNEKCGEPHSESREPPLVAGIRKVYAELAAAAAARRRETGGGEVLIATGHCYAVGGQLSELSERKIQSGNQHALPLDVFPREFAYVALGHLHRPQDLDGGRVRYCGSPLPLAMNEAPYRHSVTLLEIENSAVKVSTLEVPRAVELLAVPPSPAPPAPLDEVLPLLKALPALEAAASEEQRPLLEVRVALPQFEAGLRRRIEEALQERSPRLVKISVEFTGSGAALAESETAVEHLSELQPEEVFRRCHERQYRQPPPEEWLSEFRLLLERAQHGAGTDASV